MDYAALLTELETDPESLGYTMTNDPADAVLMNQVGDDEVPRTSIDGQELQSVVVISEYAALSDIQRMGWSAIISAGTGMVDPSNTGTIAQIQAIWGGTTTMTRLSVLRIRKVSRAEFLFGQAVGHLDIGRCRGGDNNAE